MLWQAVQYHNTGNSPVTVYYIIDSFSVSEGSYMIQWQVGGTIAYIQTDASLDTPRLSHFNNNLLLTHT